MASLFLSYDHDDSARAAPIASALEKAGHSVWWDRHIQGGAEYNDEIEAAVEKADAVVVLWSKRSVKSAWVRDEAAEGREQRKLVPVRIDDVKPPLGFRQFQTIDLSGRGPNRAALQQLLGTIERISGRAAPPPIGSVVHKKRQFALPGRRTTITAALVAIISMAGLWVLNQSKASLAVVSVAAAEPSQRSRALANDLVVKLGTLANVASGRWELGDPQAPVADADLVFRVTATGTPREPQAALVLLDGKQNGVLWSREFDGPNVSDGDLRLQLSLTAGQVLACALEAREAGGLPADLSKLFLVGCAESGEGGYQDHHKEAGMMRSIVKRRPRFKPAWTRLLLADTVTNEPDSPTVLRRDIAQARQAVPDLPLLKVLERDLAPIGPFDYAEALERSAWAKSVIPEMAGFWSDEATLLQSVGRMSDSVKSARRAVELDPLSPAAAAQLIYALAWSGRIDQARQELASAERKWPGTGAVRDAQRAFHLRYGDLRFALTLSEYRSDDPYFRARLNPTKANADLLVQELERWLSEGQYEKFGYAVQALGEFNRVNDAFAWLERTPPELVLDYVLFRPGLASVRRDPRFMRAVNRIGLVNYWRKSGHWPDFCSDPGLPYDCKEEAEKLAHKQ